MAEVILEHLHKRFAHTAAVEDVSLQIPHGCFMVLLGPTGAGKTTLLRLVAGLETPDQGEVFIDRRRATREMPAERDVAMVFQQYSLYPHLSVRDNLAFPLRSPRYRLSRREIQSRVEQVAERLHLTPKLDQRATRLSGGEMQRVAIGRALVRNPAIYLLDEPLSSLDARLRADLRMELKRLHAELAATLLYVTHDQIEAMSLADQVGVLQQGRLVQVGTPRTIYENPVSLYVATRLGQPRINLLPADLLGSAPAGAVTMGLRPEHLQLQRTTPTTSPESCATVQRIESLGDQTRLHLSVRGHSLVTLTETASTWRPGETLQVRLQDPLYFNALGERLYG
jgi:multiple sugar transport system ATP-binding protein